MDVPPEVIRYAVARIKRLAFTRIPHYELPADSFIEEAARDIINVARSDQSPHAPPEDV